jgi:serine/threonine protein kinase
MLQPGKALKKRPQYVIETEIGVGGFGVTYKAKHQDLNFPVVIKTPNSRLCRDANYPKFVEGFRKEGRRLADITQFHHPHIVRIIDFFEEDNLPCLVMDFVKGENLYHLVQDKGVLSEQIAIDYIKQIADALSLCHENGMIHRDAHPGNMILRENSNTVILIDFGLAGNVNSQSINQVANIAFAPWEQITEVEKAPSIDVYTLAASLFYLVTGDTPIASLARKLNNRTLIEPKELNSRISDQLNQAIIKGLELEPINRPQSMKEWVGLFPSPDDGSQEVELKSDVGMDYRQLQNYLKAGNWKDADLETRKVMLAVAKRGEEGWLRLEDIDNFPHADLCTIDQLWVKYSNGKFGFSVQKRIYQSLDGTREYNREIWEKFGDKVGWRKRGNWLYYSDITFNIKALEGHLPKRVWLGCGWVEGSFRYGWGYCGFWGSWCTGGVWWSLLSRPDETCNLFPVQERQPQIISTLQPVNQEVQLESSCGIDYIKLRDLLKAENWKEADEETRRVMLAVAKREKESWLRVEDIDDFPCADLSTIDQLWVKYSNGKFGFSVQKRIYQSLGGTREYNSEIWCEFEKKVGWRKKYRETTFDIKAPEGHLPRSVKRIYFGVAGGVRLFSRVETCKLFPVQEKQPQIIHTPHNVNEELQLQSSVGIDYIKLRDLLKSGKWKEADKETARVMLAVVKREKEGWLDPESIDNFPCKDLCTIDQLWLKYSNGKFSFSVQKQLYQGLGGTREYDSEIWRKFGYEVGWIKGESWLYYSDITFDAKAPVGHLPNLTYYCSGCGWVGRGWVLSSLASRLVNCNI